jgi:RNA polymerase sigma factor for flagellar operon FliA
MKDSDAKPEDIIDYLPLVKKVAARLMLRLPAHVEFDDLVGYGVLGLTEALKAFDANKKVKFSTYAFYRIKGAMLDGLRAADWLPRPLRQKIRRLETAREDLKGSLGRLPDENELASHLGCQANDVESLLIDAQQARTIAFEEKLQNIVSVEQGDQDLEEELVKIMSDAINTLEEKERVAVSLYYYEEMNLKEIGAVLGVSESRVSQLLSKALAVLKDKLEFIKSEL